MVSGHRILQIKRQIPPRLWGEHSTVAAGVAGVIHAMQDDILKPRAGGGRKVPE